MGERIRNAMDKQRPANTKVRNATENNPITITIVYTLPSPAAIYTARSIKRRPETHSHLTSKGNHVRMRHHHTPVIRSPRSYQG